MGSNPIIYLKMNYSQRVKAIVFDTMNKGSNPFSSDLKISIKTKQALPLYNKDKQNGLSAQILYKFIVLNLKSFNTILRVFIF